MKLLVLGATGGTGAEVLAQAVRAGHDVTVIARHPERIAHPESSSLRIVPGDVLEAGDWEDAADSSACPPPDSTSLRTHPRSRGSSLVSSSSGCTGTDTQT
ncbi:NAD-dependent epimerase/dehydratase family protein [Prescottella agglutinans]|uniref:NAD-dependent epimerase/dehydratase family protein n=1 Tax=Prescottella agglutinans TaxID=1644129 RepID=A0A3S3E8N8_9NOCA|nr:NAD-dependent epimerase/dehydratase family protein [Prescottella agglutinans]